MGGGESDLPACCCRLPSETYGRNGATPIFRSFTELPVPPQAAGVVGTFLIIFLYHSSRLWTTIQLFCSYAGAVEEMMCVVWVGDTMASTFHKYDLRKGDKFVLDWERVRPMSQGIISSELLICGGGIRSILLFTFVAR